MQKRLRTFIRPQIARLWLHLLELLRAIIPIPTTTSSQRDRIAQHTSLPIIRAPLHPTPIDRKGCIKENEFQQTVPKT